MSKSEESSWSRVGERVGKTIDIVEISVKVLVFFGSYFYCIATYGYLWGAGLGWLPSLIVAYIAGLTVGLLFMLLSLLFMVLW